MSDELYKWVGKEAKRLGVSKSALIRNLLRIEMEIQEEKWAPAATGAHIKKATMKGRLRRLYHGNNGKYGQVL